ncbi:hypothetical protein [Shewanella colwelliana]|uniref:hypothetical protein n=1 Tax=Shewanella colwelliana TaxID=23 RepID=UPI00048DE47F|nr:hypothetical protein [Shewanella colwelliana]
MTKPFARKFTLNHLPKENPEWWQDLLQRLKPAGEELDDYGLRLAVRENYLNFYHRGQAIAKVAFNQKKELYSEQHIKYVFEDAKTQKYVRLTGNDASIINPEKEGDSATYQGCKTLEKWIDCAKKYDGIEKNFVEEVTAINDNIIDMEMGLPGSGYRIDLVSLERQGNLAHVVFWEVKLTTDKRCRSNSESPEVLEQLARYSEFLTDTHRQQQLIEAYVTACEVQVEIAKLAGKAVSPIIQQVAAGDLGLAIDCEPRLLMYYNKEKDKQSSWLPHEEKLSNSEVAGNKVKMQIMTEGSCYKLQSKEQL